jgi:hypothetical protein
MDPKTKIKISRKGQNLGHGIDTDLLFQMEIISNNYIIN